MKNLQTFLRANKSAFVGGCIVVLFILSAVFAPMLSEHDPERRSGGRFEAPSAEHLLGTNGMGRDIYSQLLHGGRISISVGIAAGSITMIIAVLLGISAGYFGGRFDEVINWLCNIVLVLPQFVLILVLAAFIGGAATPTMIALIIGLTSWAWSARVIRAQTLVIKQKEYIQAAQLLGESHLRIIVCEILPNLIPLVSSGFIGAVIYAMITEATLEFLGLGNPALVTWGTMLYSAQNNSAIWMGYWWEMVAPCAAIATFGAALALINFSVDQIANPKLSVQPLASKAEKTPAAKVEVAQ